MNIDKIRKNIEELKNQKIKIRISIGRGKYEYLEGIIKDIYQHLFVLETNKGVKSFTYADIAMKQVVLSKFN